LLTDERALMSRARELIAATKFTYAKTMPQHPHEYFLRANAPELYGVLAALIDVFGVERPFFQTRVRYYDLDGWMYWRYQILVNRARNVST
jgi:hypothetical protein